MGCGRTTTTRRLTPGTGRKRHGRGAARDARGRGPTLDPRRASSGQPHVTVHVRLGAKAGTAPLNYYIEWRMSLARDALSSDTRSISELAAATGYESEKAFSTTFRRVAGASPRHFRDKARQQAEAG
ncbi:helix-turn-helix domain-containing protein [Streptomyces parvus]|uniref:helix-turn-helix domain-containing protein n=1 Tax=Streptomyces TaxID=1883 RepID=UPI0027BAB8C1|nr:helix-turn-helix domain-containing protein [Streptomyces sp. st77]